MSSVPCWRSREGQADKEKVLQGNEVLACDFRPHHVCLAWILETEGESLLRVIRNATKSFYNHFFLSTLCTSWFHLDKNPTQLVQLVTEDWRWLSLPPPIQNQPVVAVGWAGYSWHPFFPATRYRYFCGIPMPSWATGEIHNPSIEPRVSVKSWTKKQTCKGNCSSSVPN